MCFLLGSEVPGTALTIERRAEDAARTACPLISKWSVMFRVCPPTVRTQHVSHCCAIEFTCILYRVWVWQSDTVAQVFSATGIVFNFVTYSAQIPMYRRLVKEGDSTHYTSLPALTLLFSSSLW